MDPTLRSELLGTGGLWAAAAVAARLALTRQLPSAASPPVRRTFAWVIALQAAHFAEEYATDFHEAFPRALGLAPWNEGFFVGFNLVALAAWVVGAGSLGSGHRAVCFLAWFLALAGMANGVAHPLLALRAGAYFPGLFTSPLVGIGGALLWRRLRSATSADR